MNIMEWFDLLVASWPVRDEIVHCGLSQPGIGKTYSVYALRNWVRENTEYKDCEVVEIIASQILPNEVSGITMPNGRSHSMEIYDHKRLSSLKDGDILFFDELLQGSMQVLSACLTIIQERRLMSGKMLPNVMIVGASNPTISPNMIPEAVRQRFMFEEINFNQELWEKYISAKYDVVPTQGLMNLISNSLKSSANSTWNMLTPRSATKLLEWWLRSDIDRDSFIKYIRAIYDDYDIAKEIINSAMRNEAKREIAKVIDDIIRKKHPDKEAEWFMKDRKAFFALAEEGMKAFIENLDYSNDLVPALQQIEYNKR